MKKIVAIPSIGIILIIILFSCEENELEYSCDPFINQFVKENLQELSLLTLNELALYDIKLQRAIFNSWDYQKKRDAWIDKFRQVLVNVTFTSDETIHIQKLMDHIHEDYFLDENILNEAVTCSRFAEEWITCAANKFGWSEKFTAFMVYRLYTDPSELEAELSGLKPLKSAVIANSETVDCTCSSSADFCGLYANCTTGNCTETTSGCGWLWRMPCDGLCY